MQFEKKDLQFVSQSNIQTCVIMTLFEQGTNGRKPVF